MKKLLYLFFPFFLLNCSGSDDSSNSGKNSINPPNWIQGKWTMGLGNAQSGYEFKTNDWCSFLSSTSTCWKDAIDKSNGQTTVEETITDNSYTMKLTVGGLTQTYSFIKMSTTKIRASANGVSLYYDKK